MARDLRRQAGQAQAMAAAVQTSGEAAQPQENIQLSKKEEENKSTLQEGCNKNCAACGACMEALKKVIEEHGFSTEVQAMLDEIMSDPTKNEAFANHMGAEKLEQITKALESGDLNLQKEALDSFFDQVKQHEQPTPDANKTEISANKPESSVGPTKDNAADPQLKVSDIPSVESKLENVTQGSETIRVKPEDHSAAHKDNEGSPNQVNNPEKQLIEKSQAQTQPTPPESVPLTNDQKNGMHQTIDTPVISVGEQLSTQSVETTVHSTKMEAVKDVAANQSELMQRLSANATTHLVELAASAQANREIQAIKTQQSELVQKLSTTAAAQQAQRDAAPQSTQKEGPQAKNTKISIPQSSEVKTTSITTAVPTPKISSPEAKAVNDTYRAMVQTARELRTMEPTSRQNALQAQLKTVPDNILTRFNKGLENIQGAAKTDPAVQGVRAAVQQEMMARNLGNAASIAAARDATAAAASLRIATANAIEKNLLEKGAVGKAPLDDAANLAERQRRQNQQNLSSSKGGDTVQVSQKAPVEGQSSPLEKGIEVQRRPEQGMNAADIDRINKQSLAQLQQALEKVLTKPDVRVNPTKTAAELALETTEKRIVIGKALDTTKQTVDKIVQSLRENLREIKNTSQIMTPENLKAAIDAIHASTLALRNQQKMVADVQKNLIAQMSDIMNQMRQANLSSDQTKQLMAQHQMLLDQLAAAQDIRDAIDKALEEYEDAKKEKRIALLLQAGLDVPDSQGNNRKKRSTSAGVPKDDRLEQEIRMKKNQGPQQSSETSTDKDSKNAGKGAATKGKVSTTLDLYQQLTGGDEKKGEKEAKKEPISTRN